MRAMTPHPPFNALSQSLPYVCRSRLHRQLIWNALQRRSITQNWLRKTAESEQQWKARAVEITNGTKESMLSILEKRGYVNSIAGERKLLDNLMTHKRIGAYVGIDPTAPSMHLGHLVPLMALFWLHINGFHTVSLLGGATSKIGDPTGRTVTREAQHSSVRTANMVHMHYQLKKLWLNVEKYSRKYDYKWEWAWHRELVNNNAWYNKLPMLEVLKVLGPGMRIGTMLGRDTVKNKMENGDGMSFAEFTYPLMQAWDWWYMYQTKGIQLQIGGSDQFGNIIAGIDAINYIRKNHSDPDIRQEKEDWMMKPVGFTVPLLTTASGEKFGKSAGNAIWLDKEMTSSFKLHQFFLRSADADIGRYLRLFTFIPLPEIDSIMAEQAAAPSKRPAQRRLAREVIELLHGPDEAKAAERQAEMLFGPSTPSMPEPEDSQNAQDASKERLHNEDISPSLNPYAAQTNANNAPEAHITLPQSLVYNRPIARILYSAGLVSSRSEGHRLASTQGAYIGSRPGGGGGMPNQLDFVSVKNWFPEEIKKFITDGDLLILRVGKWKVKVVKIVSDEEFGKLGKTAPGWEEWKEEIMKKEETLEALPEKEGMRTFDNLPTWKRRFAEKREAKKLKEQQLAQSKALRKIEQEKENELKGAGYGIGKRFKVPKMKLIKYFDSRKPEEEPVRIRYHLIDENT
ncbi:MAG: tyrosyl-tRNA synthetase [Lasallia pustulata]|uniref:Tyrosine--tRNA ligase n=1 Tax=Lasallia pustulata TaxID=136370 RepID=A0A5M8PPM5_9LECA|nr:MAG: tyrosyl-tRNA synthetase [Lasallia pustulata]